MTMDSDLLRALCALASVGLPLALAWWLAGRGPQTRQRDVDEPPLDAGVRRRPVLRSDL